MSKPVVIGVPGAIEQRIQFTWDPFRGPSTIRTWIGPYASILKLLPYLRTYGYAYRFGADGGQNYRVEATIGFGIDGSNPNDPANIINTWEMIPNSVEQTLLRANISSINAIPLDQLNALATSINNNDAAVTVPTNPAITDATAKLLWNYMKKGETAFKNYAPVIRHTQTISNSSTLQAALTNVKRIISSATMTSPTGEGVPAAIAFTVPTDTDPADANLKYGWYKNYPSVTTAYAQKVQITQDWEYGLWNTLVYGARI